MFDSKVYFCKQLPSRSQFAENSVLFFDKVLFKNKSTKVFIKSFSKKIALRGGENIKTLDSFKSVVLKLHRLVGEDSKKSINIISMGGGSIGDLAGFTASVYKRGVNLVHIPTTWLAAIDSAHGGKNALNLFNSKNQIGTVAQAQSIYIVKNILEALPKSNLEHAKGEVLKTTLLSKKLFLKLNKNKNLILWDLLPELIKIKTSYFKNDLYDSKGIREKLNLGHTMGHAIELQNKFPHGVAVGWGLVFATELSYLKGILNNTDKNKIQDFLNHHFISTQKRRPRLRSGSLKQLLLSDKKNTDKALIKFVILKKPGVAGAVNISYQDVLNTAKSLKWI